MFETYIAPHLQPFLRQFFKEDSIGDIHAGFLGGQVTLEDLEFRNDVLDFLGLPLQLRRGTIGRVRLTVPWASLGKKSMEVYVDQVVVIVQTRYDWPEWEATRRTKASVAAKLRAVKLAQEAAQRSVRRVAALKVQRAALRAAMKGAAVSPQSNSGAGGDQGNEEAPPCEEGGTARVGEGIEAEDTEPALRSDIEKLGGKPVDIEDESEWAQQSGGGLVQLIERVLPGLFAKLSAWFLGSIQLTVRDVHIRWEDAHSWIPSPPSSTSGRPVSSSHTFGSPSPFSFGVFFESLVLLSETTKALPYKTSGGVNKHTDDFVSTSSEVGSGKGDKVSSARGGLGGIFSFLPNLPTLLLSGASGGGGNSSDDKPRLIGDPGSSRRSVGSGSDGGGSRASSATGGHPGTRAPIIKKLSINHASAYCQVESTRHFFTLGGGFDVDNASIDALNERALDKVLPRSPADVASNASVRTGGGGEGGGLRPAPSNKGTSFAPSATSPLPALSDTPPSLLALPSHPYASAFVLCPINAEIHLALADESSGTASDKRVGGQDLSVPLRSLRVKIPGLCCQSNPGQLSALVSAYEGFQSFLTRFFFSHLRPPQRLFTSTPSKNPIRTRVAKAWWRFAASAALQQSRQNMSFLSWATLKERQILRRVYVHLYRRASLHCTAALKQPSTTDSSPSPAAPLPSVWEPSRVRLLQHLVTGASLVSVAPPSFEGGLFGESDFSNGTVHFTPLSGSRYLDSRLLGALMEEVVHKRPLPWAAWARQYILLLEQVTVAAERASVEGEDWERRNVSLESAIDAFSQHVSLRRGHEAFVCYTSNSVPLNTHEFTLLHLLEERLPEAELLLFRAVADYETEFDVAFGEQSPKHASSGPLSGDISVGYVGGAFPPLLASPLPNPDSGVARRLPPRVNSNASLMAEIAIDADVFSEVNDGAPSPPSFSPVDSEEEETHQGIDRKGAIGSSEFDSSREGLGKSVFSWVTSYLWSSSGHSTTTGHSSRRGRGFFSVIDYDPTFIHPPSPPWSITDELKLDIESLTLSLVHCGGKKVAFETALSGIIAYLGVRPSSMRWNFSLTSLDVRDCCPTSCFPHLVSGKKEGLAKIQKAVKISSGIGLESGAEMEGSWALAPVLLFASFESFSHHSGSLCEDDLDAATIFSGASRSGRSMSSRHASSSQSLSPHVKLDLPAEFSSLTEGPLRSFTPTIGKDHKALDAYIGAHLTIELQPLLILANTDSLLTLSELLSPVLRSNKNALVVTTTTNGQSIVFKSWDTFLRTATALFSVNWGGVSGRVCYVDAFIHAPEFLAPLDPKKNLSEALVLDLGLFNLSTSLNEVDEAKELIYGHEKAFQVCYKISASNLRCQIVSLGDYFQAEEGTNCCSIFLAQSFSLSLFLSSPIKKIMDFFIDVTSVEVTLSKKLLNSASSLLMALIGPFSKVNSISSSKCTAHYDSKLVHLRGTSLPPLTLVPLLQPLTNGGDGKALTLMILPAHKQSVSNVRSILKTKKTLQDTLKICLNDPLTVSFTLKINRVSLEILSSKHFESIGFKDTPLALLLLLPLKCVLTIKDSGFRLCCALSIAGVKLLDLSEDHLSPRRSLVDIRGEDFEKDAIVLHLNSSFASPSDPLTVSKVTSMDCTAKTLLDFFQRRSLFNHAINLAVSHVCLSLNVDTLLSLSSEVSDLMLFNGVHPSSTKSDFDFFSSWNSDVSKTRGFDDYFQGRIAESIIKNIFSGEFFCEPSQFRNLVPVIVCTVAFKVESLTTHVLCNEKRPFFFFALKKIDSLVKLSILSDTQLFDVSNMAKICFDSLMSTSDNKKDGVSEFSFHEAYVYLFQKDSSLDINLDVLDLQLFDATQENITKSADRPILLGLCQNSLEPFLQLVFCLKTVSLDSCHAFSPLVLYDGEQGSMAPKEPSPLSRALTLQVKISGADVNVSVPFLTALYQNSLLWAQIFSNGFVPSAPKSFVSLGLSDSFVATDLNTALEKLQIKPFIFRYSLSAMPITLTFPQGIEHVDEHSSFIKITLKTFLLSNVFQLQEVNALFIASNLLQDGFCWREVVNFRCDGLAIDVSLRPDVFPNCIKTSFFDPVGLSIQVNRQAHFQELPLESSQGNVFTQEVSFNCNSLDIFITPLVVYSLTCFTAGSVDALMKLTKNNKRVSKDDHTFLRFCSFSFLGIKFLFGESNTIFEVSVLHPQFTIKYFNGIIQCATLKLPGVYVNDLNQKYLMGGEMEGNDDVSTTIFSLCSHPDAFSASYEFSSISPLNKASFIVNADSPLLILNKSSLEDFISFFIQLRNSVYCDLNFSKNSQSEDDRGQFEIAVSCDVKHLRILCFAGNPSHTEPGILLHSENIEALVKLEYITSKACLNSAFKLFLFDAEKNLARDLQCDLKLNKAPVLSMLNSVAPEHMSNILLFKSFSSRVSLLDIGIVPKRVISTGDAQSHSDLTQLTDGFRSLFLSPFTLSLAVDSLEFDIPIFPLNFLTLVKEKVVEKVCASRLTYKKESWNPFNLRRISNFTRENYKSIPTSWGLSVSHFSSSVTSLQNSLVSYNSQVWDLTVNYLVDFYSNSCILIDGGSFSDASSFNYPGDLCSNFYSISVDVLKPLSVVVCSIDLPLLSDTVTSLSSVFSLNNKSQSVSTHNFPIIMRSSCPFIQMALVSAEWGKNKIAFPAFEIDLSETSFQVTFNSPNSANVISLESSFFLRARTRSPLSGLWVPFLSSIPITVGASFFKPEMVTAGNVYSCSISSTQALECCASIETLAILETVSLLPSTQVSPLFTIKNDTGCSFLYHAVTGSFPNGTCVNNFCSANIAWQSVPPNSSSEIYIERGPLLFPQEIVDGQFTTPPTITLACLISPYKVPVFIPVIYGALFQVSFSPGVDVFVDVKSILQGSCVIELRSTVIVTNFTSSPLLMKCNAAKFEQVILPLSSVLVPCTVLLPTAHISYAHKSELLVLDSETVSCPNTGIFCLETTNSLAHDFASIFSTPDSFIYENEKSPVLLSSLYLPHDIPLQKDPSYNTLKESFPFTCLSIHSPLVISNTLPVILELSFSFLLDTEDEKEFDIKPHSLLPPSPLLSPMDETLPFPELNLIDVIALPGSSYQKQSSRFLQKTVSVNPFQQLHVNVPQSQNVVALSVKARFFSESVLPEDWSDPLFLSSDARFVGLSKNGWINRDKAALGGIIKAWIPSPSMSCGGLGVSISSLTKYLSGNDTSNSSQMSLRLIFFSPLTVHNTSGVDLNICSAQNVWWGVKSICNIPCVRLCLANEKGADDWFTLGFPMKSEMTTPLPLVSEAEINLSDWYFNKSLGVDLLPCSPFPLKLVESSWVLRISRRSGHQSSITVKLSADGSSLVSLLLTLNVLEDNLCYLFSASLASDFMPMGLLSNKQVTLSPAITFTNATSVPLILRLVPGKRFTCAQHDAAWRSSEREILCVHSGESLSLNPPFGFPLELFALRITSFPLGVGEVFSWSQSLPLLLKKDNDRGSKRAGFCVVDGDSENVCFAGKYAEVCALYSVDTRTSSVSAQTPPLCFHFINDGKGGVSASSIMTTTHSVFKLNIVNSTNVTLGLSFPTGDKLTAQVWFPSTSRSQSSAFGSDIPLPLYGPCVLFHSHSLSLEDKTLVISPLQKGVRLWIWDKDESYEGASSTIFAWRSIEYLVPLSQPGIHSLDVSSSDFSERKITAQLTKESRESLTLTFIASTNDAILGIPSSLGDFPAFPGSISLFLPKGLIVKGILNGREAASFSCSTLTSSLGRGPLNNIVLSLRVGGFKVGLKDDDKNSVDVLISVPNDFLFEGTCTPFSLLPQSVPRRHLGAPYSVAFVISVKGVVGLYLNSSSLSNILDAAQSVKGELSLLSASSSKATLTPSDDVSDFSQVHLGSGKLSIDEVSLTWEDGKTASTCKSRGNYKEMSELTREVLGKLKGRSWVLHPSPTPKVLVNLTGSLEDWLQEARVKWVPHGTEWLAYLGDMPDALSLWGLASQLKWI